MALKLVRRSEWGARDYRLPSGGTLYSGDQRRGVKIHYLGTPYTDRAHDRCAAYVRQLQTQHMDGNGWSDIGYSFVVCTHGYVYEGRGLRRRNSANGNTTLNDQDYAVCGLVGSSGLTVPPPAQVNGLRDAVDHCRAEGPAGDWLGGHRDGYATTCPGDALYTWAHAGGPRSTTIPQEEDDMATPVELWAYKGKDVARDAYWHLRDTNTLALQTRNETRAVAAKLDALAAPELTPEQLDTLAAKVAAHPTLAEQIAELVATKLAARLAN
ncbi:peptidoglycan recognition family protein [Streptomyces sp. NPDC057426]|uniref:peptidoglycan recognition protein family protein n=1 Tax=Streptomyces sp. NPDC057426 TaxID=3346128 RepID=UPI00367B7FE1